MLFIQLTSCSNLIHQVINLFCEYIIVFLLYFTSKLTFLGRIPFKGILIKYFNQPHYKFLLIDCCIQALAPGTISLKGRRVQTLLKAKQIKKKCHLSNWLDCFKQYLVCLHTRIFQRTLKVSYCPGSPQINPISNT